MLEEVDGVLTGGLIGVVVDGLRKKYITETIAQLYRIPLDQVAVIGDGSNDLLMMHAVGLGIALNAKENVQREVGKYGCF